MRQSDNDPAVVRGLTRRQYAQILAGASAAAVAGCTDDGGDDGDGDTGSGGADETDGTDGTDETDTDETDETGGDGLNYMDVQRVSIRNWVNNFPAQADMNVWAASDFTTGQLQVTEFTSPRDFVDDSKLLDGHTWEDASWIDDADEAVIPTVFSDYRVEAPYDRWEFFRGYGDADPLTYWDGTDMTATDFERSYFIDHAQGGGVHDDQSLYLWEAADPDGTNDEFVFHRRNNDGRIEGMQDDRRNEAFLEFEAAPSHEYANVMHPDFVDPYYERFQDSGGEDETTQIDEDLQGDRISFERFATEGWGGGLYRINPDRISQGSAIMEIRNQEKRDLLVDYHNEEGTGAPVMEDVESEHPNTHATVPEFEITFADADRVPLLAQRGQLDIGEDVVLPETGDFNRQIFPDHLQELARYADPGFGDYWVFNWRNPHLERLWVRRALVAAIDWIDLGLNGWGEESSPNQYHMATTDPVLLQQVDREFAESLYQYPIEQDLEQAATWLERAGYEGSTDGGWTGPEGRDFELTIDHNARISDWLGAHQTAESHLNQAGIAASMEPIEEAVWQDRRGAARDDNRSTYDTGIMWVPGGPIWNWYDVGGGWFEQTLVGGDPEGPDPADANPDDLQADRDTQGRPFVQQVPTEAGAFDAPDQAGATPEPPMESEEVNLARYCKEISSPDLSADEVQNRIETLARYANYYLPHHCFHTLLGGVWGNVQDFTFPSNEGIESAEDHPLRTEKEFANDEYNVLAGIAQVKTDDEFDAP